MIDVIQMREKEHYYHNRLITSIDTSLIVNRNLLRDSSNTSERVTAKRMSLPVAFEGYLVTMMYRSG